MTAQTAKVEPTPQNQHEDPLVLVPLHTARRKWVRWVLVGVGVLVVCLLGYKWMADSRGVIVYETVPVERGSIQAKVTATGTLNAVVDVLVSSQVSGNIKMLYADWNSKVKKGQLVALIDPELFLSQVDQAEAAFHSAHAASITAEQQFEKAKSDLSTAKATEKNTEAVLAKDSSTAVNTAGQRLRAERLYREQIMAQQDYDTAVATDGAAQAQVRADSAQIEAANQNIQSAEATVRTAQSQWNTALAQERETQAVLQQAQTNLDHTKILSPVDGTVVARRMDVGQTVASTLNPPTIFEIVQDLTKMQVDTNVDESDVGGIRKGQKATFLVDAYPDQTFQAVVYDVRKAPIVTQNVVTYDVVLSVNNSDLKLFPGMTANVTVLTSKIADTLMVPNSVLRYRPSAAVAAKAGLPTVPADLQRVYVLAGKKVTMVPVRFGLSDGKFTALSSGQIMAGSRVIARATTKAANATAAPTSSLPPGPRM